MSNLPPDERMPLDVLQKQAAKGNSDAECILGWRYYNGEGVVSNEAEASNLWTKAAEQTNSAAMIALGDDFFDRLEKENAAGASTNPASPDSMTEQARTNSPNYVQGMAWYRKAADAGDTNAMWRIIAKAGSGAPYFDPTTGAASVTDNPEAQHWLQQLANNGDSEAMDRLGVLYLNKTNAEEGLKWLRKAADLNNNLACLHLAEAYESGNGVKKDLREALLWWTKTASESDPLTELHIAKLYRDEEEVKDLEQSFKWFLKVAQEYESNTNASDRIYAQEALILVAEAYDKGSGVERNASEALKWYIKGAEAGDAQAEWRLGVKYDVGDGVDVDKRKAYQWYLKAAKTQSVSMTVVQPGVVEAQRNLGYLYRDGEGFEKDNKVAFYWFMKAAGKGDEDAQYEVGVAYERGVGVLQDKQEALKWYRKSAYRGSKSGQLKLGTLYGLNLNSSENRIESYKWYTLAAAQGDEDAAKLRDVVGRTMSAQEVVEANRRAKAFSIGDPD